MKKEEKLSDDPMNQFHRQYHEWHKKNRTIGDYIGYIYSGLLVICVLIPLIIMGWYLVIPMLFFMFLGKIIDFFQIVLKWFKK